MNFLTTNIERTVALQLSGTKASDRKMSALSQADSFGVVAISHGRGTVAKEAQAMKRDDEMGAVATAIGTGNFHAFAVAWAARTGETVKFGLKDESGAVVRKASEDFAKFAGVIEHKLLQLEDKGKVFTSKGMYTSAAADLMYMQALHTAALRVMAERRAEDEARRAKLANEIKMDLIESAEPVTA